VEVDGFLKFTDDELVSFLVLFPAPAGTLDPLTIPDLLFAAWDGYTVVQAAGGCLDFPVL
jgi:hypothetical protein